MAGAPAGRRLAPIGALAVSIGQHSERGCKELNQDFHGACIPAGPLLGAKGIVVALADGIGSSAVSGVAAEAAVRSLLDDYYCTPDAWSVRRAAHRVLAASNSWLHAQTRRSPYRYEKDLGYVCTLSALVLRSRAAHVFHVGDTRIHRVQQGTLEQLTEDHRVRISSRESFLSRALGFHDRVEIDYRCLPIEPGETFLLSSDGVHEHVDPRFMSAMIEQHVDDLDAAARSIIDEALRRGSLDNLTVQIVRVDGLPDPESGELSSLRSGRRLAPPLEPRIEIDGYRIERDLHISSRSHIHLGIDIESGCRVAIKSPSIDMRDDPAYLERFLLEEWIARRIDNAHVARPFVPMRTQAHLLVAMEYIEGTTLAQWMRDHSDPGLDVVRGIVEQIARGLQAFHRMEMLHQDIRPENIMIDEAGTVKIIDFGAAHVAGLAEATPAHGAGIPGTHQYAAPEYFLGEPATPASDLFSLGVITYQMLTGRLPYGTRVASIRTRSDRRRLAYAGALDEQRAIPAWIDEVLRRAVHPDPAERHEALSEFVHDLRHPSPDFLNRSGRSLLERNPLRFWKGLSLVLALLVFGLFAALHGQG